MPTAFTVVVVVSVIVPPVDTYFAVPDPGTGVLPSVVYQMPVLPRGPTPDVEPRSVKVTTCEPLKIPLAGEIAGVALVCTEPLTVEQLLPVPRGVSAGLRSSLNQPPALEPGVQTEP